MEITFKVDRTAVKKLKIDETTSDFAYWQTQSYETRLATLEALRQEYMLWKNDTQQRFQRVYRIIKPA